MATRAFTSHFKVIILDYLLLFVSLYDHVHMYYFMILFS